MKITECKHCGDLVLNGAFGSFTGLELDVHTVPLIHAPTLLMWDHGLFWVKIRSQVKETPVELFEDKGTLVETCGKIVATDNYSMGFKPAGEDWHLLVRHTHTHWWTNVNRLREHEVARAGR